MSLGFCGFQYTSAMNKGRTINELSAYDKISRHGKLPLAVRMTRYTSCSRHVVLTALYSIDDLDIMGVTSYLVIMLNAYTRCLYLDNLYFHGFNQNNSIFFLSFHFSENLKSLFLSAIFSIHNF